MYMTNKERSLQKIYGRKVEKMFNVWLSKNSAFFIEPTDDYTNKHDKIDYFLTFIHDSRKHRISVDTKSPCINKKYNNDIVNINYEDSYGNPGTIQKSKAEYYAILGKCNTDNSWRYFVVNANVLKNYVYNELTPHYGRNKTRYYSISIKDWVNHNWTFQVKENGSIVWSKHYFL